MGNQFRRVLARGKSGFSLVELMIVVAIIGILAALAVPRFQKFQAKAKQAEAKSSLSHIYTLEQTYFGDYDQFSNNTTTIGFQVVGKTRYAFTVALQGSTAGGPGFMATANAQGIGPTNAQDIILVGCGAIDQWNMDDQKKLNPAAAPGYDCTAH